MYKLVNNSKSNPASSNTREAQNLAILQAIKQGDFSQAKKYSGFGGLRRFIGSQNAQQELLKFLSPDEVKSLSVNTSTGYYTPDIIVDYLYQIISKLGFRAGRILENSCGSGVFFERMPHPMRQNSEIIGVEIEPLSASIAQHFYPDVTVHTCGFQDFNQDAFDLIIGNPPYASMAVIDKNHLDLKDQALHHYFVAKSVRLLKPNGLAAFILPTYVLDNLHKHARNEIAQVADLVCAYRLPENLFQNAKVTVDLVVFKRKGDDSLFTNTSILKSRWQYVSKIELDSGQQFYLSQYYIDNPKHIIGELSFYEMWLQNANRMRSGLCCKGDLNLVKQKLPKLIDKLSNLPVSKSPILNQQNNTSDLPKIDIQKSPIIENEIRKSLLNAFDKIEIQFNDLKKIFKESLINSICEN